MPARLAHLDKSLNAAVEGGFGTITIRVVVLEKGIAAAPAPSENGQEPLDALPDELLPETDKRPTSTFLEEPKRGRQVCVFLINGQRQHAWDNLFIARDLDLKYLRNRMLVVVDCDGLRPEATAELMQGSRHQFLEGHVYSALESRVIATLKGDPDLRRLEEQAEDEIANLQAGDEAVKAALDQLIEAHHQGGSRGAHGHAEGGQASRDDDRNGALTQTQILVDESETGELASEPILQVRPEVATIRLKPNEARRLAIRTRPDTAWKGVMSLGIVFDPPLNEMQVSRQQHLMEEELTLNFVEGPDFDPDEYPIEATMRAVAAIEGHAERRILERRVVITPPTTGPLPKTQKPLVDDPTFIKVTSRQPIKLVVGGSDVHVKLRWDGKDELTTGNPPEWNFRVSCDSPSVEPQTFLTKPVEGRFELLIQARPGLTPGEELRFDVEAVGPGKNLSTAFVATVVESPSPRKLQAKQPGGAQRRPPYELKYLYETDWANHDLDCFGQPWSAAQPGAFEPPNAKSPLMIFINNDTDLLRSYRDALVARRLAENTIHQRINKYTAHVAFHLYQMYLKQKADEAESPAEVPTDAMMRDEIQRVATTLIKLMEIAQ